MLKLRNIIIIFIAVWMCIDFVDFAMERSTLATLAHTATVYNRIAAECALKSATMSDDFFTAGTTDDATYNNSVSKIMTGFGRGGAGAINYVSDANGYRAARADNMGYVLYRNPYEVLYGDSVELSTRRNFAKRCFDHMYANNANWQKWAENILKFYKDISDDTPAMEKKSLVPRSVVWSDIYYFYYSLDGVPGYVTMPVQGTIQVPKLITMGGELFSSMMGEDEFNGFMSKFLINDIEVDNDLNPSQKAVVTQLWDLMHYSEARVKNTLKDFVYADQTRDLTFDLPHSAVYLLKDDSVSDAELFNARIKTLLNNADYWDYKRTTSIGRAGTENGNWSASVEHGVDRTAELDFYYTPTSLGLTYIDADLLNMLYRNNLDLLMRSKYINGNMLDDYNSVVQNVYYPDSDTATHATSSAFNNTFVNNGQFYYERGNMGYESDPAGGNILAYYDMDGNKLENPQIEYIYLNLNDGSAHKQSMAELMNDKALRNVIQRAISPVTDISSLKAKMQSTEKSTYELVIAKVKFEADFIIPYVTKTMRGMAQHYGADEVAEMHALDTAGNTQIRDAIIEAGLSPSLIDFEVGDDEQIHCYYTTYYAIVD